MQRGKSFYVVFLSLVNIPCEEETIHMISVLPKLICVGWGFVLFFSLVCLCFELVLCAEGVCVL